jgi:hypothetical protein
MLCTWEISFQEANNNCDWFCRFCVLKRIAQELHAEQHSSLICKVFFFIVFFCRQTCTRTERGSDWLEEQMKPPKGSSLLQVFARSDGFWERKILTTWCHGNWQSTQDQLEDRLVLSHWAPCLCVAVLSLLPYAPQQWCVLFFPQLFHQFFIYHHSIHTSSSSCWMSISCFDSDTKQREIATLDIYLGNSCMC